MKPSHRIQNDVGYKKIFPMSLYKDDTFCHYCGRRPMMGELRLEWDHVPALNVRIPDYVDSSIHKTLIRSCSECNRLASDMPHMDYMERHIWLKNEFLKRYKKLLINGENESQDGSIATELEKFTNYNFRYCDIMHAIGFGISDVDQISSPILELKTKSRETLRNVLIRYLYGSPLDEEDEIVGEISEATDLQGDEEYKVEDYTLDEFINFACGEYEAGTNFENQNSYDEWLKANDQRAKLLELPKKPSHLFRKSWSEINKLIEEMILENEERYTSNESDNVDDFKASLEEFIWVLAREAISEDLKSESLYREWINKNLRIKSTYGLPDNPGDEFGIEWSIIYSRIEKNKYRQNISDHPKTILNLENLNSEDKNIEKINQNNNDKAIYTDSSHQKVKSIIEYYKGVKDEYMELNIKDGNVDLKKWLENKGNKISKYSDNETTELLAQIWHDRNKKVVIEKISKLCECNQDVLVGFWFIPKLSAYTLTDRIKIQHFINELRKELASLIVHVAIIDTDDFSSVFANAYFKDYFDFCVSIECKPQSFDSELFIIPNALGAAQIYIQPNPNKPTCISIGYITTNTNRIMDLSKYIEESYLEANDVKVHWSNPKIDIRELFKNEYFQRVLKLIYFQN